MSSFDEVQFPPLISYGAIGGPRFNTTVTTLSSGAEQRNINWSQRRGEWDVSQGMKTEQDIEVLIAFFHNRYGKARGFRYKDWTDYRLPRWIDTPGDLAPIPVQMVTNGVTATFQIQKPYVDPLPATFWRPIYKPVVGTVSMLVNGVNNTNFTVDTTTGIVTLLSSVYTTTGDTVAITCEFDTPCRFDTDDMKLSIAMIDNFSWPQIPIVETREIS